MSGRVSQRFLLFVGSWFFAFLALFFQPLFQPHFEWNLKLLEIKGGSARLENPSLVTTVLFQKPSINVYSKEGYRCLVFKNEVTYIQNRLLEDKRALERLVEMNIGIGDIIFWIAMLSVGYIIYGVIRRKLNLKQIVGIILLLGILWMVQVTMMVIMTGPLSFPHFTCGSEMKIEAELVNVSLDGLVYFILSWSAMVISVILIVIGYFPSIFFGMRKIGLIVKTPRGET